MDLEMNLVVLLLISDVSQVLKWRGVLTLEFLFSGSTTLSTIWLSDIHSPSKMVFNVPNLNDTSLDFSNEEIDSTDLTSMMDSLEETVLNYKTSTLPLFSFSTPLCFLSLLSI